MRREEYASDELTAEQYADKMYREGQRRIKNSPIPYGQKFLPGSLVWIKKNLGESMSHFKNDCPAMVQHTYAHAYGSCDNDHKNQYSLLVRYHHQKWSSVSWYYGHQLEEITDPEKISEYKKEIDNAKPL